MNAEITVEIYKRYYCACGFAVYIEGYSKKSNTYYGKIYELDIKSAWGQDGSHFKDDEDFRLIQEIPPEETAGALGYEY